MTAVLPDRDTCAAPADAATSAALPVSVAGAERPRPLQTRTGEDWLALLGSIASSLALAWLLYEQILPFSGKIGFFLTWYGLFVAVYALATALGNPRPVVVDRVVSAVVSGGVAIVFLALMTVLLYTVIKGYPAWKHWSFFIHDSAAVGPTTPLEVGGIEHAITGTLWEIGIAVVISLPLGLLTALYLSEGRGRAVRFVRIVVESMTALPDLIAGLFVYTFLILEVPVLQKVGFAAALALSITMVPIVARSSEVVLRVVPGGLREASLALGSSRWRTVWTVILPTARPGLATALILAMARGIGETAPLLIVSSESNFQNKNPFSGPMNSLPLYIYDELRSGEPLLISRAFGAASVLLVLVAVLFVIVRLLSRQRTGRA